MPSATIIRTVKDKDHPYKLFNTTFANDKRLSFEARGLMAYLLSKPDDWQTNTTDLIKQSDAGRDKIYRMLRELQDAGYLERRMERDEHGVFNKQVTYIHEIPITSQPQEDTPLTEKPETAKPLTDKADLNKYGSVPSMESLINMDSFIPDVALATQAQPIKPRKERKQPDSQHHELLRRYEQACGYPLPNAKQEGKSAAQLLKAGYTVDQIIDCYTALKKQPYWQDKPLSLASVAKQIGPWLQSKGVKTTAPVDIRQIPIHVPQLQWLVFQERQYELGHERGRYYESIRTQRYMTPDQYQELRNEGMPPIQQGA